jgi:CheY-like chemotaxis protein
MVERSENTAIFGACTILEADDGLTALEIMKKEAREGRAIDIVLLDYIMINLNGPEAARRMRSELGYRGVIVGITGNALPEELAFFKANGADSVITKPLTNAKLIGAIQK